MLEDMLRKFFDLEPRESEGEQWCEVPIRGGLVALVDVQDAPLVMAHQWTASVRGHTTYARATIGAGNVYMHRFLLEPPPDLDVDHVDGNGLNNRRGNLRVATRSQNMGNRHEVNGASQYHGVYWRPPHGGARVGYWVARVRADGRVRQTYHHDEVEAARSYNRLAKEAFGAYARQNLIEVFCQECGCLTNHRGPHPDEGGEG